MHGIIEFLKALADPTRMKIIKLLQEGEVCVCELVDILGISQPGVSQHLRRLKLLGLTEERREGQRVIYSLVVPVFDAYVKELNRFLALPAGDMAQMQPLLHELKAFREPLKPKKASTVSIFRQNRL